MRPESVMVEIFGFAPLSFNNVCALDLPLNQDGVLLLFKEKHPAEVRKGFPVVSWQESRTFWDGHGSRALDP